MEEENYTARNCDQLSQNDSEEAKCEDEGKGPTLHETGKQELKKPSLQEAQEQERQNINMVARERSALNEIRKTKGIRTLNFSIAAKDIEDETLSPAQEAIGTLNSPKSVKAKFISQLKRPARKNIFTQGLRKDSPLKNQNGSLISSQSPIGSSVIDLQKITIENFEETNKNDWKSKQHFTECMKNGQQNETSNSISNKREDLEIFFLLSFYILFQQMQY